jgi:hypothetical protein
MKTKNRFGAALLAAGVLALSSVHAQVPNVISYQGFLTEANGDPVNGTITLVFGIYSSAVGGTPLYSETQSLAVRRGVFHALIGSVTPLPQQLFAGNAELYLEITVNGAALTPRRPFTSVPYAFHARRSAEGGAGDITAIIAGEGLAGGGTEGEVTLSVADSGLTANKIANSQVVKSLNHLRDAVTLAATGGATISTNGDTIIINAGSGNGTSNWSLTGNAGLTANNFLGSTDNSPVEFRVNNQRALLLQPNATSPNVLAGFGGNDIASGVVGATISGGGAATFAGSPAPHRLTGNFATISGGVDNQASSELATVGGGAHNYATGLRATIAGGWANNASNEYTTIGGGFSNAASGLRATVSGGFGNQALGNFSSAGGGVANQASGDYAAISGGYGNATTAGFATIAGGGRSNPADVNSANRVTDDYGTVGGGGNNQAGDNSGSTTDAFYAVVAGGKDNVAGDRYASVGGGDNNRAGEAAHVGGGQNNVASGISATIGGGALNVASGTYSTIAGGADNVADGVQRATVGGGSFNSASGSYSTVPGGGANTASGDYSFAAGQRAKAIHHGAFVWADATLTDFSSTNQNQFLLRASGGVGINTNAPQAVLDVAGPGIALARFDSPGNTSVILEATNLNAQGSLVSGIQSDISATDPILQIGFPGAEGSNRHINFRIAGTSLMTIRGNGNIGIGVTNPANILAVAQNSVTDPIADAWTTYSSRRWKTNIRTIDGALEKVLRLRGVYYDRKETGEHDLGLIAEEVGEVVPEVVRYEANGKDAAAVDYARLVALLIEAVKEQQKKIAALEAEMKEKGGER